MNSPRTLLIVDDDPYTRRSLTRTLTDPDWRILQADCAQRALSILERTEVTVVISDFHMGADLDGALFLEQVDLRFPAVVRILLTSDTATSVMVSAVNDGRARRVLYKPWSDEQIRTVVRQCMRLPPRKQQSPGVYTLEQMGQTTANRLAALLGVEISKD